MLTWGTGDNRLLTSKSPTLSLCLWGLQNPASGADLLVSSKKSQASRASAWERRKSAHLVESRSGAGSIPASLRISHTVEGGHLHPQDQELAVDAPVSPMGVLLDQAQDQDADGTHGRWPARSLRLGPGGVLSVDQVAEDQSRRTLDGKYLLATSDPDITAEEAALGYKNLLEAERGFRDMKSTLDLRPVHHRLERRIRAHVLLCWLALLLIRIAERETGQTWPRINRETGRLAQVTLTGPAGTLIQTTPLRPAQTAIYRALHIDPPPRIRAFDPS
ncbi:MAG TPA: hypothetical protein VGD53_10545 [Actinoallomurus sp.]|jgi:hypothetical protein